MLQACLAAHRSLQLPHCVGPLKSTTDNPTSDSPIVSRHQTVPMSTEIQGNFLFQGRLNGPERRACTPLLQSICMFLSRQIRLEQIWGFPDGRRLHADHGSLQRKVRSTKNPCLPGDPEYHPRACKSGRSSIHRADD